MSLAGSGLSNKKTEVGAALKTAPHFLGWDMDKSKGKAKTKPSSNKLCTSCRRTCKQVANAIVAKCPRYYPFNRKLKSRELTWKQMDLGL